MNAHFIKEMVRIDGISPKNVDCLQAFPQEKFEALHTYVHMCSTSYTRIIQGKQKAVGLLPFLGTPNAVMIVITILTAGIKHKNFMIFMAGLTCSASFETSPIQPRRPLRPRWTVLCSVDLRYLLPNRWILLRHCCPLVVPNQ